MEYWCERYNMSCEEALYSKCNVTSYDNSTETGEECIDCIELEVGVLGNDDLIVSILLGN